MRLLSNEEHTEALVAMRILANKKEDEADTEMDHVKADDILRGILKKMGYIDIVELYDKIYKWYA